MLKIHLLGPLHIELDNVAITGFNSNKTRALLAYLSSERQTPQPRAALANLIWPAEPEARALSNLRQAINNLKKNIGETNLEVSRATVRLNPAAEIWVDTEKLLEQISLINQVPPIPSELPSLEEISSLYRGDFLTGFYLGDSSTFDEWTALKRESLHNQMATSILQLAEFHQNRGAYDEMLVFARKHLELDPWNEAAHRLVMVGLAHTGRRAAAVQQYAACKEILGRELGILPATETNELYKRIRDAHPRHNLPPQPSELIGRQDELGQVQSILASPENRLLTLLGPGGIGKTRLAIEVAHKRLQAYLHGVIYVPLAEIDNPALLLPQIANAAKMTVMGAAPLKDQLIDFLRDKELLLVLDNFEQLVETTPILVALMQEAPELNMLVTSRARLRLQQETVLPIEGLPFENQGSDAVVLFESVAQRALADFSLAAGNQTDAQKICALVEGMPLGIELTAAWVQDASLAEIVRQLTEGLEILRSDMRDANPRHQSMQVVFAHSWKLLNTAEQTLLQQLAVFRGPFTTAAIQDIYGDGTALEGLVDKSLVQNFTEADRTYYRLHELIRQYSLEKFKEDAESYRISRNQHAAHYLSFLGENAIGFVQKQENARREIPHTIDNIRVAWDWALQSRLTKLIESAAEGLLILYQLKDWYPESLEVFSTACEIYKPAISEKPTRAYCLLLKNKGVSLVLSHQYDQAATAFNNSAQIAAALGDTELEGIALDYLGYAQISQGASEAAEKNITAAIAIGEQLKSNQILGEAYVHLGILHQGLGNAQQEKENYLLGEKIFRAMDNQLGLLKALNNSGIFHAYRGNFAESRVYMEETLEITQNLGVRGFGSRIIGNLAMLEVLDGNYEKGIGLQKQKLKAARDIGNPVPIAHALVQMGAMLMKVEPSEQVLLNYQDGLAIYEKVKSKFGISFALLNIASYYIAVEEIESADLYYQKALSLSVEISHFYHIRQCVLGYAHVACKRGEFTHALKIVEIIHNSPDLESENATFANEILALLKENLPEKIFAQFSTRAEPTSNEDVLALAQDLLDNPKKG